MLSRTANATLWMSRYIERAENLARFIEVNHHLLLDLPVADTQQWEPLVMVTGEIDLYRQRYGEVTPENVVRFLAFDDAYPNSIVSCLRRARDNARSVREVISSEMWQQVNVLYLNVNDAAQSGSGAEDLHSFAMDVMAQSHLFGGLAEDTMSHGEAWHFIRMGRFLERADKTSRILDTKYFMLLPDVSYVGTTYDNIQWAAVLKSVSALEMYRKRYHRILPERVAEFLFLDREFPRAIHFCLIAAEESLHLITGSPARTFSNTAERTLGQLRSEVAYTDINEVVQTGMHEHLDRFQGQLNQVGEAISATFFATRPTPVGETASCFS